MSKTKGIKRKAPSSPTISPTDYRNFLNRYISGKGTTQKEKKSLKPPMIKKWEDTGHDTDQERIVNEIAKKFNNENTLGISKATYKQRGPNSSTFYGMNKEGKPQLDLVPQINIKDGPNPIVVGHELVHANDHQGTTTNNRLNPQVWRNLGTLAATGGTSNGPMRNFNEFGNSIGRIQNKIDIPGDFRESYPIDRDYIENDINGDRGTDSYQIPLTGQKKGSLPDWQQLFQDINSVVTSTPGKGERVPNQGFYLNRASEFPAFMSENLTRRWHTDQGQDALREPEARFVHSTLGNMGTAYPAAVNGNEAYPTMNRFINERRRSLENAYNSLKSQSSSSNSSSSSSNSKKGEEFPTNADIMSSLHKSDTQQRNAPFANIGSTTPSLFSSSSSSSPLSTKLRMHLPNNIAYIISEYSKDPSSSSSSSSSTPSSSSSTVPNSGSFSISPSSSSALSSSSFSSSSPFSSSISPSSSSYSSPSSSSSSSSKPSSSYIQPVPPTVPNQGMNNNNMNVPQYDDPNQPYVPQGSNSPEYSKGGIVKHEKHHSNLLLRTLFDKLYKSYIS